ncbi:hypothetical protein [Streptomyces xylophagus]|uniref:hypothetical protein n=1 Tax=Streptomyces xylophagus TaxID=285514 RepID=UPI000B1FD6F3|nr:hypothetical protein [Streptomyces xylophagus]
MRELWQEHVKTLRGASHRTPQPSPEGTGMANKIEIRPLDKKETTSDSGPSGN